MAVKKYGYIFGVALFIIAIGFFIFSTFFKKPDAVENYPSQGTDIIAFGDSLVEGIGATTGNDFVSLLSKKIDRPIINLGHSGDTTAQGFARLSELNSYHPQVVFLLLGGNDHLQKVPIAETFDNLSTIIVKDRLRL